MRAQPVSEQWNMSRTDRGRGLQMRMFTWVQRQRLWRFVYYTSTCFNFFKVFWSSKLASKFSPSVFLGYQFEENLANVLSMKLLKLYNNYFRNFKDRNFQEVQIVFQLPNPSPKSFWIVEISVFFFVFFFAYQYKLRRKSLLISGPWSSGNSIFFFEEIISERRFSAIPNLHFWPYLCHYLFLFFFVCFLFFFLNFSQVHTHMRTGLLVATSLYIR